MRISFILGTVALLAARLCFADVAPNCLDNSGNVLQVMDQQVIQWKNSTPNEFRARALVQGVVDRVFPDHSGHRHFEISIGPNSGDTLEVIYNESFGQTPPIQVGDKVEACGDYITAYAQSGPYPPSPSGAIIHWIHQSDTSRHENGFLMINGVVYGRLGG